MAGCLYLVRCRNSCVVQPHKLYSKEDGLRNLQGGKGGRKMEAEKCIAAKDHRGHKTGRGTLTRKRIFQFFDELTLATRLDGASTRGYTKATQKSRERSGEDLGGSRPSNLFFHRP